MTENLRDELLEACRELRQFKDRTGMPWTPLDQLNVDLIEDLVNARDRVEFDRAQRAYHSITRLLYPERHINCVKCHELGLTRRGTE